MMGDDAERLALKQKLALLKQTLLELSSSMDERLLEQWTRQLHEMEADLEARNVASILGNVLTQGGDFVGRDKHTHISLSNVTDEDVHEILSAYYRALIIECNRLPLQIVDPNFSYPSEGRGLSVSEVYIPLDVFDSILIEDSTSKELAQRSSMQYDLVYERQPILTAIGLEENRRVVVLGEAGSGKSTFVNKLTSAIAHSEISGDSSGLPRSISGKLVIRVVLHTFIEYLTESGNSTASAIWDFLKSDISAHLGGPAAERVFPVMQGRILRDGGVFLLDGLDEVSEASNTRGDILAVICSLANSLPDTCHFLVTARPYAYADETWQLEDFSVLKLAPFTNEQARKFVQQWLSNIGDTHSPSLDTEREANALLQKLGESSYLEPFMYRPLLLTLIVSLVTGRGMVPNDRSDLFEESVKLLLSRWQQRWPSQKLAGNTASDPGIARTLGLGENLIRLAVEHLAYTAHVKQTGRYEAGQGASNISLGEVLEVFTPYLPHDFNPVLLIEYLETRSGLLVRKEGGTFSFPHRLFQEYLCACYLANSESDFASKIRDLIWTDRDMWREVLIFGTGKKKQGGLGDAIHVINTLVPVSPGSLGEEPMEMDWLASILAAKALVELNLLAVARTHKVYKATVNRIRSWLAELILTNQLSHQERLEAGDLLAVLGDPRVGITYNTIAEERHHEVLIPDIDWVLIPSGPFCMGSKNADENKFDDECPQHEIVIPDFYISRYPVTNAQFSCFVGDGGYESRAFWTDSGWLWRQGEEADLSVINSASIASNYADWFCRRPKDLRNRPYWWTDTKLSALNRPVVGVNWHEAMAFCSWLTTKMPEMGSTAAMSGNCIRLPNEPEWEKAARGQQAFEWPWGNSWDQDAANIDETGLQQTSTVGLFYKGASPFGVQDMAGNVWEWTLSSWGLSDPYEASYRYPYRSDDGRESLGGLDFRVVRGGSWLLSRLHARCSTRSRAHPLQFRDNIGFRIVVSSPIAHVSGNVFPNLST